MFDLDPPPAELQGRYRLLDEIGRGGMGQVYRVLDLRDGCERALKWVPGGDPVRAEETRHLREFSILARFEHPNILRVHEYGALEDRSGSFFTADLLQGPSLHRGGRNLPESDRITALCDLLRALAFLHRQGWGHGDSKPDNLRGREPLGREGNRLCLLDFGLAHPEGRPPEEKILGTPHYMAPERLLGGRLDRRGDLYSFGVLAYQLLTGILPFDGNRHTEVFEGHLRTEAIDPRTIAPAVPAPIAQLLLSLLEKRAEDRPADAEEVRSLLLESWPHRDASPESRTSLLAHIRLRGGTEWQSITDAASRHFADRVEWTSPIHEAWSRTAAPDLLPGAESPLRSIAASTQRSGMLLVEADHASDRRLARREIIRELQVRGARILPWNLRRADGVQELAVEIEALDGSRPSRAPSGR
ncbi:MAG: protein kinase domain-containing protein, partial [Planctomycetota bacterium]